MIDTLRIKQAIHIPKEVDNRVPYPIIWNDNLFYPSFHQEAGYVKCYTRKQGNMRITIYEDWLYIDNSIHKFFKGNNYSDFTRTDLKLSFEKLSDELHINVYDGLVKKLSYGCNLTVAPDTYLDWNYFNGKKFQSMTWGTKMYGASYRATDYKIKGYDKGIENKLHYKGVLEPSLFRYEVEVNNMRHLQKRKAPIPIYSVNDLVTKNNLTLLMNDLITKFEKIEKSNEWDYSQIPIKDKKIIWIMESEIARFDIKANHKDVYKDYRKRYNKFTSAYKTSLSTNVQPQIKKKFSELINN